MKKEYFSTKLLAEIAILSAMTVVLDMLQSAICKFFPLWPNGGSVGIAMVPIFILAYRRGLIPGIIGGLIVGLLDILDGVDVSPLAANGFLVFLSVMLDYILAWTLVGTAGAFSKKVKNSKNSKEIIMYSSLGVLLGGGLRFLSHFFSGLFMWEKGTEVLNITIEVPHWLYSLLYNGSYLLPCIIICGVIMALLLVKQPKVLLEETSLGKEVE